MHSFANHLLQRLDVYKTLCSSSARSRCAQVRELLLVALLTSL
jgi:hypothetical protein